MEREPNMDISSNSTRTGVGTAHGKIILAGEHSVVYDYPAIALPLPGAKVTVETQPSSRQVDWLESLPYTGPLDNVPEELQNLSLAIDLTHSASKLKTGPLHFRIKSSIPIGRGMGSSAAVSVALIRSLVDYMQIKISDHQLTYIANQAEVIAHGWTSGLDTLLASTDSPVIYRKSSTPIPFQFNLNAYLIVADSGMVGQTKLAVGKVHQLREAKPEFVTNMMDAIGGFVSQAIEAIQHQDIIELGRLMTYNHYYLNQLGVSNATIDHLVNQAWMADALGAKLTGAGLGGCIIALAYNRSHAQHIERVLLDAGAQQTWLVNLNAM